MANEMIRQVEVVSSHFSYTEEYVLDKSIAWVGRKFEQSLREKHDDYAQNANSITSGVFNSIMAAINQMFGGKGEKTDLSDMLVKGYDETMKKQRQHVSDNKVVTIGGEEWDTSLIDEQKELAKRRRKERQKELRKQQLEQG